MTDDELYELAFKDTKPGEIAARLDEYDASLSALWSDELAERFKGRWAAAYKGNIVADGDTFDDILRQLKEKSIPSCHTAVEFYPIEQAITAY